MPSASASPPRLRLYLDTADVTQWAAWYPTGVFYGVTTNPLLLERSQLPCTVEALTDLAQHGWDLGMQEVQLQTWGHTLEALVTTGQALAAIDPRVVVKVPITRLGTEAAAQLMAAGVRVTLTGVYAAPQMLIAAALGVAYAAPYLGRITDLGANGRETLSQMQQMLDGVHSSTRILAASIRTLEDLSYLAARGLNTFTVPVAIAAELFSVSATQEAAADFERAAQAMGGCGHRPVG